MIFTVKDWLEMQDCADTIGRLAELTDDLRLGSAIRNPYRIGTKTYGRN